jgi:hypothetical protein
MKKILGLIVGLVTVVNVYGAVEFDLRKGVDLTATNYHTASLINQLVDAGTISATNKGALIRRSGGGGAWWPSVTDNPRYTNFMWLDQNTSPATLKQYVPSGDVYTNWVASTVTPGSVGTSEIAANAVTAAKLATNSVENWHIVASAVSGNKIADNGIIAGKLGPASITPGNNAFGSIVGGDITNKTITATNIADNTITRLQLANDLIGTVQLTNKSVTMDKIADGVVGVTQLTNSAFITTNYLAGGINSSLLTTNVSYGIPPVWGFVKIDGTFKGVGISAVARDGVSAARITFITPRADTNYCVIVTSLFKSAAAGNIAAYYSNQVDSVWIRTSTDGGANSDSPLSFVIHDF